MRGPERRLVITVCPRESGVVTLPVERGGRAVPLDAAAVVRELAALVGRRGVADRVRVQAGCAGGCGRGGPNVDVRSYAAPRPGERPDEVALGCKTYVYSLPALRSLAAIIDENLDDSRAAGRGRRAHASD